MAIIYRQGGNDDLAPLKSVGIDDDSATAWWAGAQKCFAGIAVATALASSLFAAQIGQQVTQGEQSDVPAGALVNSRPESNDYWQQLAFPAQAANYQRLPYLHDSSESAFPDTAVDDDYWVNPVLPQQATLYRSPLGGDAEEIPAGSLFGQADEDFWQNAVKPVVASHFVLLPIGDPEEIPAATLFGQPDEDLWVNAVRPVVATLAYPQQFSFDVQEPAGSLFGQYDEDFWRSAVPPCAQSYRVPLLPPDSGEFVAAVTSGNPDEDYWLNPTRPVVASLYQRLPLGDPEEIPAGSLLNPQPSVESPDVSIEHLVWGPWKQRDQFLAFPAIAYPEGHRARASFGNPTAIGGGVASPEGQKAILRMGQSQAVGIIDISDEDLLALFAEIT